MAKTSTKRWAISKHQWLAIFGGLGLLVFGLSGMLHIVMTTWGPQQAVFFPPQHSIDLSHSQPIDDILRAAGIKEAVAVKVIAGDGGSLLQVTEQQLQPRRYFDLATGVEHPDHDAAHALFLARHYLKTEADVREVQFLTDFTPSYPPVNRLLPVYHIRFERPDDLSIYVYTETNASAGVSNRFKMAVQTGFRWFHTWDWFPKQADWGRALLMALFVGALFALVVTGLMMLVTIKRARRAPGMRGYHRIAGYVLALPLLMFTTSGLYHLVTYAGTTPQRILQLSQTLDLAKTTFPIAQDWAALSQGLDVNSLSLVQAPDGTTLFRLGLAPHLGTAPETSRALRNARFDGVETTGPALYVRVDTGAVWRAGDEALALALGERFSGAPPEALRTAQLVTRFGPTYDFRNKRLPVWQLDYGAPVNATVFVDTASGALVDILPDSRKPETWSFSLLHKWNFLRPLGRDGQNIVIAAFVLSSVGLMGGIGLQMYFKARRGKKRARLKSGSMAAAGPK